MIDINVTLEAEIRGKEKKTSTKTGKEYLIVRTEDDRGKTSEIVDYDVENFDLYKKGSNARLGLHVSIGKYSNVEITSVEILND